VKEVDLLKKFQHKPDIKQLQVLKIIKLTKKGDIKILFLDEQLSILSKARKLKQLAGAKGGKQKSSNATAQLKQNSSYKDKDKDKDKDKERKNIETVPHWNEDLPTGLNK
jgi:hypothetical protein